MSKLSEDMSKDVKLMIVLVVVVIILIFFNFDSYGVSGEAANTDNIQYEESTNTLYLDSLTLKQKIAQMVITYHKETNKERLQDLFIGGIHMGAKTSKEEFMNSIDNFQDGSIIPMFISVDLEGCANPFENFQEFPALNEINTKEEAFKVGYDEGKLLKEMGFSINFAPVVDLDDKIWKCRSFEGSPEEISEKAKYYIDGLQENGIVATSKHYPGKTLMLWDPHKYVVHAPISRNDLMPFEKSIEGEVSAIMVSHIIADGYANSENKPSVVSEKLIGELRNKFTGLIITDEIRMLGLSDYYSDVDQMYIDLFKAENDVILNFDINLDNLEHMISVVEKAVIEGEIKEERIDDSVERILNAKGVNVIR